MKKNNGADKLSQLEREARELGLSYGLYMAYRETGGLEHYKKMRKHRQELMESNDIHMYKSCIGGGKGHPVSNRS